MAMKNVKKKVKHKQQTCIT